MQSLKWVFFNLVKDYVISITVTDLFCRKPLCDNSILKKIKFAWHFRVEFWKKVARKVWFDLFFWFPIYFFFIYNKLSDSFLITLLLLLSLKNFWLFPLLIPVTFASYSNALNYFNLCHKLFPNCSCCSLGYHYHLNHSPAFSVHTPNIFAVLFPVCTCFSVCNSVLQTLYLTSSHFNWKFPKSIRKQVFQGLQACFGHSIFNEGV